MFAFDPSSLLNAQVQAKVQQIQMQGQLDFMKAMGMTKSEESIADESKVGILERVSPLLDKQREVVDILSRKLEAARAGNMPEAWLQEQYDNETKRLKSLQSIGI